MANQSSSESKRTKGGNPSQAKDTREGSLKSKANLLSNRFEGTQKTSSRVGGEGVDEEQVRELIDICLEERREEEQQSLTQKIGIIVESKLESMGA